MVSPAIVGAALLSLALFGARPARSQEPLILTVEEAIALALQGNFGLQVARHGLASAQSSLIVAKNEFDFKLSTRVGDARTFQRNQELTRRGVTREEDVFEDDQGVGLGVDKLTPWGGRFAVNSDFTRFRAIDQDVTPPQQDINPLHASATTLSYEQPLWGGRGKRVTTAALVRARSDLLNEARSLAERETQLALDTTRAFFQVVRSERFIEIDQAAVARAEENLRTYRLRLEEGLITPIDVARAEAEVRSRQNTVITDEESHRGSRDALLFLLGLPLDTEFDVRADPRFEPAQVELEGAITEALSQRVDLRTQRDALELAGLDAHVARSAKKPRVDLVISAGLSSISGDEASKWLDLDNDDTWRTGLGLAFTFGDRGDDEAYIQSLIAEDSAKIRLRELERRVVMDVRDAVRSVRSLERQIELLDANVELARESLRLASLQLEEDLIRTTDLLQIQDELVRAETSRVDALSDHAVARTALDLALGRYRTRGDTARSRFLRDEPSVESDVVPYASVPARAVDPDAEDAKAVQ